MISTYRKKLFDGKVHANGTITSEIFDIDNFPGFGIQLNIVGAGVAGSCKLQTSMDGVNWDDIGSSSNAIAGPDVITWNISLFYFSQVRVWVNSSNLNNMTLTAIALAKSN